MAFENFPWTSMHELNLDWIMEQVAKLADIDYVGLLDHNVELSTNFSETDPDTGEVNIKGSLRGAIIDAVDNYYLHNVPMLAKYSEMFTAAREQRALGIHTLDNKVLVPFGNGNQMIANGNPMGALLCMASFLNKGITYGHTHGMFNTDPAQTDFDQMVCSDFTACGLRAISYNNSKAGGCGKNYETAYKSRTWPNNTSQLTSPPSVPDKDALLTREMAYIFAAYGALWELDYDNFSNVQQGDVLFFSSTSSGAGVRENFMNIHHEAIVLDVDYPTRTINVLESEWPSQYLFQYSFTAHDNDTHYHGPSYDSLKLGRHDMDLVPTRKVWVGRPSWPALQPLKIPTYSTSTHTETMTGNYDNFHTMLKSNWGWQKGDICHLHLQSDMNQLNPDGTGNAYTNLRIAGKLVTPDPDDPDNPIVTYPTIWISTSRSIYKEVPNDREIFFVVDDDYDEIRLMVKSTNDGVGKTITVTDSMDIYRMV